MWTRRRVLMTGVTFSGVRLVRGGAATLTAGEVIDRIKAKVAIPWRAQTVDNIIAGTRETPVRGLATTMMATFDVLQRAATAGCNMVVTHEPTFYSHQDATDAFADDPIYRAKREFIEKHQMIVFHFHDHWHARTPDGIAAGMERELGWETHADPRAPRRYVFDGIPLADFARDMRSKLKIDVMRVVGDPALRVRRVATSWGYASLTPSVPLLAEDGVDVLVVGETREWEMVEYAQDMMAAGKRKGLVILGHVVSEQAGMKYCAEWLREFVTEVPVTFVAAAEPYWDPRHPPR